MNASAIRRPNVEIIRREAYGRFDPVSDYRSMRGVKPSTTRSKSQWIEDATLIRPELTDTNNAMDDMPLRLLAVEDDHDTQCNLRDILGLAGYQVDVVATINEVVRLSNLQGFFAFILDRQLPDGTVEKLLPHLRNTAPNAGILIVTGHADLDGTIAALRHGVDDYILKPIDPAALRGSLIRIYKIREARNRLIQTERLAAIGQMVSGIAHESRNFLQKISASVETLQEQLTVDPDVMAELASIQRGCDGLMRLLGDLREYSAPIKLDRCGRDLAKVWRAAWKSLSHKHCEKSAALIECSDSQSAWCSIDVFRMEQVFRNLFENSLAACSSPARITVHCENGTPDDMLRITVSDNGPGLPADQRGRVFEPFFTTKSRGTGLGLSIVRRIVEAHGGRITPADGPSQGAVFELEIPVQSPNVGEISNHALN
jgi:signal transduction histidine kinase